MVAHLASRVQQCVPQQSLSQQVCDSRVCHSRTCHSRYAVVESLTAESVIAECVKTEYVTAESGLPSRLDVLVCDISLAKVQQLSCMPQICHQRSVHLQESLGR